jgi:hypothetical protein
MYRAFEHIKRISTASPLESPRRLAEVGHREQRNADGPFARRRGRFSATATKIFNVPPARSLPRIPAQHPTPRGSSRGRARGAFDYGAFAE